MWYGVIRFFIESLRTDSLMLGSLRMAQVISIVLFIVGIMLIILSKKKERYIEYLEIWRIRASERERKNLQAEGENSCRKQTFLGCKDFLFLYYSDYSPPPYTVD